MELQKDRFAPKFREIERPGIEINPENEVQREEDQLGEMGGGPNSNSARKHAE